MEMNKLFELMLNKQNELNILTAGELWKEQGFNWKRAIWLECGELVDSTDWKWWKAGQTDIPNIHVEVIDVWHFVFSFYLEKATVEDIVSFLSSRYDSLQNEVAGLVEDDAVFNEERLRMSVEHFVGKILHNDAIIATELIRLSAEAGLNLERIFSLYMGKNVLNKFRQDNGYKEGTYNKQWKNPSKEIFGETDTVEDNVCMQYIMSTLEVSETFFDDLYEALEWSLH